MDLPPPAFDHPYDGPKLVIELPTSRVIAVCGRGPNVLACSWPPLRPGMLCTVFVSVVAPSGVSSRTRAVLDRHELGHCNGWRHE